MDELDLVRRSAPPVAPPDDARRQHARLTLAAAATRPRRRGWPDLRPRRTITVAIVAALVGFVLVSGPFPFFSPADPAAVVALQDAATIAARGPAALDIGEGYIYTTTDAVWAFSSEKFTYLRPLTRQFWIAADGSGRIRETVEEPIFLSEAEREVWLAGGFQVFAVNEDIGPGELLGYEYGAFPTGFDALRDLVRQLAAETHPLRTDEQMFVLIGDMLRDPLAPPDLRASLFAVAASLPGIQLLGEMQDQVGREGLAVSMTWFFNQEIIIFDPETSALLEERTVRHLPYGDTPAPIVWSRSTYLEARVVSELPDN